MTTRRHLLKAAAFGAGLAAAQTSPNDTINIAVVGFRGRVALSDAPAVHGVKPAADVTLKSAAQAFGARVVGVVLTGMGRDGALGLAAVKAAGGRTIAQDKNSSTVYGMPKAAVEMGVVDEVLALDRIGRAVSGLVTS